MRRFWIYVGVVALAFLGMGCDEGKIYPDETIDTGRTAQVTVSFKGLEAWPKRNTLSVCEFGEDRSKALLSRRLSKPSAEGKTLTVKLTNVKADTRTIEVAVINRGLELVYSYYSVPVDDSGAPIEVAVGEIDLGSFDRIKEQVFKPNCIACHGGSSSGLAGGLDLREEVAYRSLVNVKAPLSEEGKNYVTPGDIHDSYLLDILNSNPIHSDMFNSSGKQEVLGLIRGWILGGALDN